MSTASTGLRLSPQEALARDLIVERVAARHRAHRRRHPSRAAVLLRSLADRLDRSERLDLGAGDRSATAAGPHAVPAAPRTGLHDSPHDAPHAGQPRPWAATARRAPHRHSG
ncbi:hypothetical protein FHX52_2747 [Humibacillus xanthopallidus]|uniref:Uncharacterized protein n=1 Tax=Humibacillus xanthopallidus TaxID=412689 RepID=A0A543PPN4_9MICO|nr:hypothetical protein [Humibacillus xanthopallidus]TQN46041.1 hypothetical protein FHX52_2747 [Humibacillus xanthopallidus]